MSRARRDGQQYGRFWYYTPNHPLDYPKNEPYKSAQTITIFNTTYKGEDRQYNPYPRHHQCFHFQIMKTTIFSGINVWVDMLMAE